MNSNTNRVFLSAAIAGILSAGLTIAHASDNTGSAHTAEGICVEKNGCIGKGSCKGMQGGKTHDCKGLNSCSQNERTGMTEKECKNIDGTYKQS